MFGVEFHLFLGNYVVAITVDDSYQLNGQLITGLLIDCVFLVVRGESLADSLMDSAELGAGASRGETASVAEVVEVVISGGKHGLMGLHFHGIKFGQIGGFAVNVVLTGTDFKLTLNQE